MWAHRNAGFIRQRPVPLVALPDKSGVPVALSMRPIHIEVE